MPQQAPLGAPQMPGNGLLGAAGGSGLQMAMSLSRNPTPQMAQAIIAQLKQSGNPEAHHFEQALTRAGNSPEIIKNLADVVVQKLSGVGNA